MHVSYFINIPSFRLATKALNIKNNYFTIKLAHSQRKKKVKKFYFAEHCLKWVHEATYNIKPEELLKPKLHK